MFNLGLASSQVPVPEPSTILLLSTGLVGFAGWGLSDISISQRSSRWQFLTIQVCYFEKMLELSVVQKKMFYIFYTLWQLET